MMLNLKCAEPSDRRAVERRWMNTRQFAVQQFFVH
jgi:hypothetical protein